MFFAIKNSLIIAFFGIIITTFLSLLIIFIRGYFPKKIRSVIDIVVTLPLFYSSLCKWLFYPFCFWNTRSDWQAFI